MNKNQSNKLNSYQSVKGVLEDNRNLYEPIAIINQSVGSFFDVVNEIDKIATKSEIDTTGETSAKIVAKEKLASLSSALAASGMVYGFERSDVELEAALDYSYSDIRYARDAETLQISRAIESELLDIKEEVVDYMVSEENMTSLHTLIDDFEGSLEIRGGAKSESVAVTRRLAILFREADDMLKKRLDRFITRLKPEYPTFYDAYRNARMIVDL